MIYIHHCGFYSQINMHYRESAFLHSNFDIYKNTINCITKQAPMQHPNHFTPVNSTFWKLQIIEFCSFHVLWLHFRQSNWVSSFGIFHKMKILNGLSAVQTKKLFRHYQVSTWGATVHKLFRHCSQTVSPKPSRSRLISIWTVSAISLHLV